MNDDTTIRPFHQPGSIIDPLTEIAREVARRMLMVAPACAGLRRSSLGRVVSAERNLPKVLFEKSPV